ncbi:hypothetical protein ACFL10_01405 [Patescibacteria group bacterium]
MSEALSAQQLKKLEGKAEKGVVLTPNVKKLANETSATFAKYKKRMDHMPPDVKAAMKKHIAKYFLMAADRFDKNATKGLSKEEFGKYHRSMIAKTNVIVNKYAPSQELIDARMRAALEVKGKEKELSKQQLAFQQGALKVKDKFSTFNLASPARQQQELLRMQTQSIKLQNEAAQGLTACGELQTASIKYLKLSTYQKKKNSALYNKIKDKYKKRVLAAKKSLLTKVENRKKDIEAHGKKINEVAPKTKKKLIEARQKSLKYLTAYYKAGGIDVDGNKNNKMYNYFHEQQEMMNNKKQQLLALKQRQLDRLKKGHTFTYPEAEARDTMDKAADKIDKLIKTPAKQLNMTEKQKQRFVEILKKKRKTLHIHTGLIHEKLTAKKVKRVAITEYIEGSIDPALTSMDDSIRTLEVQKLRHGNVTDRVNALFMPLIDGVDNLAKVNADAILDINIRNTQVLSSLKTGINTSLKVSGAVKEPSYLKVASYLQSKVYGFVFNNAAAPYMSKGVKWLFRKQIAGNLESMGNYFQKLNIPGLEFTTSYLGSSFKGSAGTFEGISDMLSGVADMSADWEKSMIAMMAFIGRDPRSGKWSLKTAWNARKQFEDAFLAVDDFKKGNYEKGAAKAMLNIVTTIFGGGEAAAAKGAGQAGKVGVFTRVAGRVGKKLKGPPKPIATPKPVLTPKPVATPKPVPPVKVTKPAAPKVQGRPPVKQPIKPGARPKSKLEPAPAANVTQTKQLIDPTKQVRFKDGRKLQPSKPTAKPAAKPTAKPAAKPVPAAKVTRPAPAAKPKIKSSAELAAEKFEARGFKKRQRIELPRRERAGLKPSARSLKLQKREWEIVGFFEKDIGGKKVAYVKVRRLKRNKHGGVVRHKPTGKAAKAGKRGNKRYEVREASIDTVKKANPHGVKGRPKVKRPQKKPVKKPAKPTPAAKPKPGIDGHKQVRIKDGRKLQPSKPKPPAAKAKEGGGIGQPTTTAKGTIGRDTVAKTAKKNKEMAALYKAKGREFWDGKGKRPKPAPTAPKPATATEKAFDKLKNKKDRYVIGGGTKGNYDYGWKITDQTRVTRNGKVEILIQKGRKGEWVSKEKIVKLNERTGPLTRNDSYYYQACQELGIPAKGKLPAAQVGQKYKVLTKKLKELGAETSDVHAFIKKRNPELGKAAYDAAAKDLIPKGTKLQKGVKPTPEQAAEAAAAYPKLSNKLKQQLGLKTSEVDDFIRTHDSDFMVKVEAHNKYMWESMKKRPKAA